MESANTTTNDTSTAFEAAADLLNQQIWCWGQDIEAAQGNLLLQRGFERTKLSEDTSSVYRLELSAESRIVLRGFCVYLGQDGVGGLFVRRFGFAPKFSVEADMTEAMWRADEFSHFQVPTEHQIDDYRRLLLGLVDWTREYETSIVATEGIDYRIASLANWKSVVPAEGMVAAWTTLGSAIANAPNHILMNHTDE